MAKRPSNSLSLLAETAEEYIKLECARRRNQMSIRRRSSLLEQYNVRVPMSRLQERQAQTRHHEFLVRKDNKSALDVIVDRVRELAELYSLTRGGGSASPLSPMEKARLLAWADDVEKVLYEFEPSENHNLDPIVRMLEKLQFLQDGYLCLAEVAVDARALLEKWERDGVFDTSDNDGEGNGDDDVIREEDEDCYGAAEHRRSSRPTNNSHAYDTIRQRAAANLIKRNVLRWVRSQESFRDRVEEIQFFGRTTQSLMKELTSTASMRRPTVVSASNDIFDLVKVKRDGMYAHSIGFKDLMHFSKYVALFPVDQAIRTVKELEMKRFLFENRCALKLQTIWRKARKEFQARRMRKLVEELKLQREKQAQEERECLLLLSAGKGGTPDTGDDKRRSVLSSPKKHRAAFVATPPSTASSSSSSSRMSSRGDDLTHDSQPSTPQSARLRGSVAGMGAKRKESKSRTAGSNDSKKRFSKVKSMNARERSRFDDDDGDTKDVETAWQSFLDSTTGLDDDSGLIPVTELSSDQMPGTGGSDQQRGIAKVVMPPSLDDDWKNWSDGDESGALRETDGDDEADLKAEEKIARRLSLAASTALPVTPASESVTEDRDDMLRPRNRVKNDNQDASSTRRLSEVPAMGIQSTEPISSPSSTSSYGFQLEDDADRFRIKKTRVGRLSVMAPFAERETPQSQNQSQPNEPERGAKRIKPPKKKKHLHDMDFGTVMKSNLALLQLVDPLVATGDSDSDEDNDDSDLNNEPTQQGGNSKLVTYVTRPKGSTRKRRVDIIKHSIAARETTENITYRVVKNQQRVKGELGKSGMQDEQSAKTRTSPEEESGGRFTYPIQKLDIRKEVVMRRASQHQQSTTEPARSLDQPIISGQPNTRRATTKKFGTHAEWLRSMGLEQTVLKSPRPPPSRLKTPQRPSESQKSGSMQGDDKELSSYSGRKQHTKPMRKRRLKRFLPTLDRQTASDIQETKTYGESSNGELENKKVTSPKPESSNLRARRVSSTRKKSTGDEFDADASRASSGHLNPPSSRNVGGGLQAQEQSEPSESERSDELSSEDSSDAVSEINWSEDETSERDEMKSVERDIESRSRGGRSEHEQEGSGEEPASSGDEDGVADAGTATGETDQAGPSGAPHARVHFSDETKKTQPPHHSSQALVPTRKKQMKKRHLELRDTEFTQDDHGSLDLPAELHESDSDGGNTSSLNVKSSNIRHGLFHGNQNRKTKSKGRGAARSQRISGRDEYAEDERREPEEAPDAAAAAAAIAKRQERKNNARHAAFQRLMMQYLGLLQCSPHEAILPPGSGSSSAQI